MRTPKFILVAVTLVVVLLTSPQDASLLDQAFKFFGLWALLMTATTYEASLWDKEKKD